MNVKCQRDTVKVTLHEIQDIEITSWLVSAYDFYSRVVKDPSQRVNNKNRINEPTMK